VIVLLSIPLQPPQNTGRKAWNMKPMTPLHYRYPDYNHHRSEKRDTARDIKKPYTWTKKERDEYILRGIRPAA